MKRKSPPQPSLPDFGHPADGSCRICGATPEHYAIPVSVFDERGQFSHTHPTEKTFSKRTRIVHDFAKHTTP